MEYFFLWIYFTILLSFKTVYGADCFICSYTSHCNGVQNNTGECQGSCDPGWFGSLCQQENVAYSKEVFVNVPKDSSTNHGIIVDGNTDQNICIQEYKFGANNISLDVDFGKPYLITDVAIFYQEGDVASFRGFSVYLSMKEGEDGQLCYQHLKDEPLEDVKTIKCQEGMMGQYLILKNSRANPPYPSDYSTETDLRICEIQAFACAKNTFGDKCEKLCHCYGTDECQPSDGLCPGQGKLKCKNGWVGDMCDKKCAAGYGTDCSKQCSDRHCSSSSSNSSCNSFDGSCDNGCAPGYQGNDCTTKCAFGFYGDKCQQRCDNGQYCKVSAACNHVTGICDNGCQPGWRGQKCDSECDIGFYGDKCQQECDSGQYCKVSAACDHVTGICDNGCQPGWRGQKCDSECAIGFYGDKCQQRCDKGQYCKVSAACNHVTGICDNECQSGWRGQKCDSVCFDGTFGDGCQQLCHCYGNTCDPVTGICPGSGRLKCQDDWSGDKCDQECTLRYGNDCSKQCSDRKCSTLSTCNSFDGLCDKGCLPGYQGNDCTKECNNGFYGAGCSLSCKHSEKQCQGGICDHVTGECTNGCEAGWQGNKCTDVGEQKQDNGLDRIYVGIIGVVCGIIFCIICIIVIYFLCRKRWKRNLIIKENQREPLYDDIRDLPPEFGVNNNAYETPSDIITGGRNAASLPNANRPLPRIVVNGSNPNESTIPKQLAVAPERTQYINMSRDSSVPGTQGTAGGSRPKAVGTPLSAGATGGPPTAIVNAYEEPQLQVSKSKDTETANNVDPSLSTGATGAIGGTPTAIANVYEEPRTSSSIGATATTGATGGTPTSIGAEYEEQQLNVSMGKDTDSISTVSSCCSDKLTREKDEVNDAANNIGQKRPENEYVKMGQVAKTAPGATVSVTGMGTSGEEFVNLNYSNI